MCTVSVLITKTNSLVLTSNRDEKVTRPTLPPEIKDFQGQLLMYPMDVEKGGTWIAASEKGRVACLLNGGFENHVRTGDETMSRGRIVLDCFSYDSIDAFVEGVELLKTEPFTLLIVDAQKTDRLHELIWDGVNKQHTIITTSVPALWSSATLYSKQERQRKKDLFTSVMNKGDADNKSSVFDLHAKPLESNGFYLTDSSLKTVSITQIEITEEGLFMDYFDFLLDKPSSKQLKWNTVSPA